MLEVNSCRRMSCGAGAIVLTCDPHELDAWVEALKVLADMDQRELLDKTADGVVMFCEGPLYSPDGRVVYVEPFSETPHARLKHEDGTQETWGIDECFWHEQGSETRRISDE